MTVETGFFISSPSMTQRPTDINRETKTESASTHKTKSVFVTGGTGLVGSHLITALVKEGREVRALYRSSIPEIEGKEKVTWIQGDILDVISLDEAMTGVDHVYHCAAIVSYNPKRKDELFRTNIEGTANVVNSALNNGVKKVCFVSSVAALGRSKKGSLITENDNWSDETNDSNYSKSKYLAELEVWRGIGEGLPAVMVNPSIIFGSGDWNDSSIKIFKTAYEEFPWYTEGVTGFVDVLDVVKAMIQLTNSEISGQRFILTAENLTYKQVFTNIAKAFGKKPPQKKVSPLIAGLVWRLEAVKSMFSGEEPLLSRETATAAQSVNMYDGSKIKNYLTSFQYNGIEDTIVRVCNELKDRYKL
jgi:nucleoside-diphosphate-sugar epimerase